MLCAQCIQFQMIDAYKRQKQMWNITVSQRQREKKESKVFDVKQRERERKGLK